MWAVRCSYRHGPHKGTDSQEVLFRKVQVEGMGSEASEIKTIAHGEGECSLPDCFCHVAQRLEQERSDTKSVVSSSESLVVAPTFTEEWELAPRWATRTTEQIAAEYWFLRGGHAKEVELTGVINKDLREIRRVAGERGWSDERLRISGAGDHGDFTSP